MVPLPSHRTELTDRARPLPIVVLVAIVGVCSGFAGCRAAPTASDDAAVEDAACEDAACGGAASPGTDLLAPVLDQFYDGLVGDDRAAARVETELETIRERLGDDPRVLAYLGSARLLAARRSSLPWNRLSAARKGLALLDRAVDVAGDDVEIRFLRGITTRPLPGFFGRARIAKSDLAFALERAEAAYVSGRLPERAYRILQDEAGDKAKDEADS